MKTTISLLLLHFFSLGLAQSSLDEYIAEGLENNRALSQKKTLEKKQEYALKEAKGNFLPSVRFEANYSLADGGRLIDIPVGDLLNPVYSNLNQINGRNDFPLIENVSEQFLPNDFHETKIRLIQPIYNTEIIHNHRINKLQIDQLKANTRTEEASLVEKIKTAYFQYAQVVNGLNIYELNEKTLQEVVRFNESRFEQDQITKDELYQSLFELREIQSEITSFRSSEINSKAYFNYLIGKDLEAPITLPSDVPQAQLPLESAGVFAENNRSELVELEKAMEIQNQVISLNQSKKLLPEVALVADAGYQGFGYTFDNQQDFWFVNFNLSWNLFEGYQNQNRIKQAQLQQQFLEQQREEVKEQIQLQQLTTRKTLDASFDAIKAKRAELTAAKQAFRIIDKKYRAGQVLYVEYAQALNTKMSTELDLSNTYYEFQIAQAQYERAISN